MTERDPNAFARKHWTWLIPACGVVMLLGFLRQNTFAVAGGVLGLVWVARALWAGR